MSSRKKPVAQTDLSLIEVKSKVRKFQFPNLKDFDEEVLDSLVSFILWCVPVNLKLLNIKTQKEKGLSNELAL